MNLIMRDDDEVTNNSGRPDDVGYATQPVVILPENNSAAVPGGGLLLGLAAVFGVGAWFLITVSKGLQEQQKKKEEKNNESHGYASDFDRATMNSVQWVSSGLTDLTTAKQFIEKQGARVLRTKKGEGYIGVKDKFGLPWLSRITYEDQIYCPPSAKGWIRQLIEHSFGQGDYLHLVAMHLPEVYTYSTPLVMLFFSADKDLTDVPDFFTNNLSSFRSSKLWRQRIDNRGEYNDVVAALKANAPVLDQQVLGSKAAGSSSVRDERKNEATTKGLLSCYHTPDEVRDYFGAVSRIQREVTPREFSSLIKGWPKSIPTDMDDYLSSDFKSICYSTLPALAAGGVIIADHRSSLAFGIVDLQVNFDQNSSNTYTVLISPQGGKEIGTIVNGKIIFSKTAFS